MTGWGISLLYDLSLSYQIFINWQIWTFQKFGCDFYYDLIDKTIISVDDVEINRKKFVRVWCVLLDIICQEWLIHKSILRFEFLKPDLLIRSLSVPIGKIVDRLHQDSKHLKFYQAENLTDVLWRICIQSSVFVLNGVTFSHEDYKTINRRKRKHKIVWFSNENF